MERLDKDIFASVVVRRLPICAVINMVAKIRHALTNDMAA